jgi:beta-lactam-binding protein with PASTA domain
MRLMRDLVGETLSNRYQLVSRIAGGGMGEVYRGHDLLLDRTVAVKVLMPSLANDPDLVARFKAEARSAARLNHPNVVAVHDWGAEDERTYYMVMEYVAGTDLRDVLVGRGPLEPAHAVEVMIAVCDALEAAHSTGLVHRDIKPENVLIARDGTVKVADFGIAGVADVERTLPGGSILGTLRYLSPEQAVGDAATLRSDLWAAGAVLFELVTGTPPQSGSGAELLRRRAVEPPVPPSSLEPGIPPSVDAVVIKACAVDPADRFATAAEMAAELRRVSFELGPRTKPVKELMIDITDEVMIPGDMATTDFVDRSDMPLRRRRSNPWMRKVALGALAVLLLLGGWQGASALLGPQEIDVPSLVGVSEAIAERRAVDAGLEFEVVARERDADVPEGNVISQAPEDGVLLEGETVEVVVSAGLPLARVPDLVGEHFDAASKKLTKKNLAVGEIDRVFSLEPSGTVIEQSVTPGSKEEWHTGVDLTVSKGPKDVAVPSVVGLKEGKAIALLEDAGFTVVAVEVYDDKAPVGEVVYSTPAASEMAPEASEVQIGVSMGPEYKEIKMPDVRGMHVDDAKAKLADMGFINVGVTKSCPGTMVADTLPGAGTLVRQDERIQLFVCG